MKCQTSVFLDKNILGKFFGTVASRRDYSFLDLPISDEQTNFISSYTKYLSLQMSAVSYHVAVELQALYITVTLAC